LPSVSSWRKPTRCFARDICTTKLSLFQLVGFGPEFLIFARRGQTTRGVAKSRKAGNFSGMSPCLA
jgi:hypothetical protein